MKWKTISNGSVETSSVTKSYWNRLW